MKLSALFSKTSKTAPADETSRNAQLLIQAGYVYKEMAGVYAYLPLGLAVLEKIKDIIRQEMEAIGGQELIMTSLQRQELWQKTDRWDDEKVDVWFKSKLKNGTDIGFAWSHEEQITDMMRTFITSYRDLPVNVYQFQTKLRNELRAKSGIMRGREFVMKDMYTYSKTEADHRKIYEAITNAYQRIFEKLGIGDQTYFTYASGGAFTQFSHEFQTISEAGEDIIYIDRKKHLAINEEVLSDAVMEQVGVVREDLEKVKASEVGNIFSFGSTKSEQLDLFYTDEDGNKKPAILGSYGIGVTRLMGIIVEHFSDDKGLVWPSVIAPALVYLASINSKPEVVKAANELYQELSKKGVEVLYDDREVRAGEKFADADLMGLPIRIVISEKTIENSHFEFKERTKSESEYLDHDTLMSRLTTASH
ncbi:MAG: proline--tRNA ligase [Candidatus Saccharimonadales bacterium]